jgi:hypothetical protein
MTDKNFINIIDNFSINRGFIKKLGLIPAAVLQTIIDEGVKQRSMSVSFKNLQDAADYCGLPNTDLFHKAALKLQDLGYITILMPCQLRKKIQYSLTQKIMKEWYE